MSGSEDRALGYEAWQGAATSNVAFGEFRPGGSGAP